MPIIVFGNNSSSYDNDNKIDTGLFVQKPYLRFNYIESNIEEDIDLKNQFRIANLPDPISIREPASKNYVDNKFNDPSIIKNTGHIDLKDENITNARFIQVNQLPQIDSHLTAKLYVDNCNDKSSSTRNNQDNDFNNYNLTNINSITLNTQAANDNQVNTKAFVDQFHQENEQFRRDLGIDFYNETSNLMGKNEDNDLNDEKLTNLDSVVVNREPTLDDDLANKKYVDESLGSGNILRLYQILQNYLKVSVRNDTYNLTKNEKIKLTGRPIIEYPNSGGYLLEQWNIKCNDKKIAGKKQNFIGSTKTNNPSSNSGATSLPPIGDSFMYIETSSNNHGPNVFVSWERTDIIQITNITFYHNSFSILTDDNLKNMGRFRIQRFSEDNTWSTQNTIPKNGQYTNISTDWTLLNLDFHVENYGIKLILEQIDTAHSDVCFSNITITYSVY